MTGANGFIGTALCPMLEAEGHEVWRAVRYHSGDYNFYDDSRVVYFDLRDSQEVRDAVRKVKPDVVIHLAAVSQVAYSFTHPEEVNDVVYAGTIRLAEAAREVMAHFIQASSSEVYGRADSILPLTEEQRIGGTSPYASAKCAAEEYLTVLSRIYRVPITILRPFNTVGRCNVNNKHYVVERAITRAIEQGIIQLHDPRPGRDFLWRDDHARAYVQVLKNLEATRGEVFNICTGGSWTIAAMAEHVAKLVGEWMEKFVPISWDAMPDRPLDIPRLIGSNQKAKEVLGWVPTHTIAQAIEAAAQEWLLARHG